MSRYKYYGNKKIIKNRDVIDLIKYHMEDDDINFKATACKISNDFYNAGQEQVSEHIGVLLNKIPSWCKNWGELVVLNSHRTDKRRKHCKKL